MVPEISTLLIQHEARSHAQEAVGGTFFSPGLPLPKAKQNDLQAQLGSALRDLGLVQLLNRRDASAIPSVFCHSNS